MAADFIERRPYGTLATWPIEIFTRLRNLSWQRDFKARAGSWRGSTSTRSITTAIRWTDTNFYGIGQSWDIRAAVGEILRAAIGGSHLSFVVRKLGHIRNGAAVILWWIVLLASIATPMPLSARVLLLLVLVAGPIAALSLRRRSLSLGLYSFVAWNVVALGMLTGLFRKRVSPAQPLSSLKLETHAEPNVSPIT